MSNNREQCRKEAKNERVTYFRGTNIYFVICRYIDRWIDGLKCLNYLLFILYNIMINHI